MGSNPNTLDASNSYKCMAYLVMLLPGVDLVESEGGQGESNG